MHYLAFGPTVHVLSNPWDDSTVVPCAKMNCRPWVTVYFALGTTVFITSTRLGIHVAYTSAYRQYIILFQTNNNMVKSI